MNIQSNFANINGTTLHYLSAGTGKLLLFLHGFPTCSDMWEKQLLFFSTHYHAIALDLPGFYLSDTLEKITLSTVINHIKLFIRHLGYTNAIIIGHDIGGFIAAEIAAQCPSYVEKLVLMSALPAQLVQTVTTTHPQYKKIYRYMDYLADPRAEEKIKKHDYHYFWKLLMLELTENALISVEKKHFYESNWKKHGALKSMLAYYQHTIFNATTSHNPIILTDTLILLGEDDLLFPIEMHKEIKSYFPYHKLKVMKENAHWLTYKSPSKVNRSIIAFLRKDFILKN